MDLEQEWKKMGEADSTKGVITITVPGEKLLKNNLSPLFKIKTSLKTSLIWAVLLTLLYIAGIYFFTLIWTRVCITLMVIYCCISIVQCWKIYNSIDPFVSPVNSLRTELERNYQTIMRWYTTQQTNALFLYPIGIMGGFMLGLSTEGIDKMNRLLLKPLLWVALAGCMLVLVPCCYYLTRWMMKVTYDKQLKHLKDAIDSLEES
jgi:hypothetical protein